jgi:hypothetical protein
MVLFVYERNMAMYPDEVISYIERTNNHPDQIQTGRFSRQLIETIREGLWRIERNDGWYTPVYFGNTALLPSRSLHQALIDLQWYISMPAYRAMIDGLRDATANPDYIPAERKGPSVAQAAEGVSTLAPKKH